MLLGGLSLGALSMLPGCASVKPQVACNATAVQEASWDERLHEVTARNGVAYKETDPRRMWADILRPELIPVMTDLAQSSENVATSELGAPIWHLGTWLLYQLAWRERLDESDCIADYLGVISRAGMAGLQRQYTLSHIGCSSALVWDEANSRMVHFRSLDWAMTSQLSAATRIFDFKDASGRTTFHAAGILGMVGLLTAVRPGFSVAINFAPWPSAARFRTDPTFLLRNLMESEKVTDYAGAYDTIKEWKPGAPVFIILCGTRRDQACVFQFGLNADNTTRYAVRRIGPEGILIQTNHFSSDTDLVSRNAAQILELTKDDCWDRHDLTATSMARQMSLEIALRRQDLPIVPRLQQVYSREPVWNHETTQIAMMTPADGGLRLWARRV